MDNQTRVDLGHKAIKNGTPDYGENSDNGKVSQTDLVDTLANLMHFANAFGYDFPDALRIATDHFKAETDQDEG